MSSLLTRRQSVGWQDFDHSQTLCLGYSASTCIAYKRENFDCVVLRSCSAGSFSQYRKWLAEVTWDYSTEYLLPTLCLFSHQDRIFVGSSLSDISLADIIDCTLPLDEGHLASILSQVARALLFLQESSKAAGICLIYGSLKATNIFVTREGIVQLGKQWSMCVVWHLLTSSASFGQTVQPQKRVASNCNRDRNDLGPLATHMLSRSPDGPGKGVLRQKMLSNISGVRSLDVRFEPTHDFVDFMELCSSPVAQPMLEQVVKHQFLRTANPRSLRPLVMNAERSTSRPCSLLT